MEKATEFSIDQTSLKEYLEECLTEQNINYEIKIEDRWIQKYKNASNHYQVYCIYVDYNNLDKINKLLDDFKNATIITDNIEELKDIEDEEENDKNIFKFFTLKNFLKLYWLALIIMGILIVIGINFTS